MGKVLLEASTDLGLQVNWAEYDVRTKNIVKSIQLKYLSVVHIILFLKATEIPKVAWWLGTQSFEYGTDWTKYLNQ